MDKKLPWEAEYSGLHQSACKKKSHCDLGKALLVMQAQAQTCEE